MDAFCRERRLSNKHRNMHYNMSNVVKTEPRLDNLL